MKLKEKKKIFKERKIEKTKSAQVIDQKGLEHIIFLKEELQIIE